MFENRLKEALESVKGGEAVILMGFDGIPVDSYEASQRWDIETVGMEFSVVLKEARKAAELLNVGPADEMTIRTDQMATVLRVVSDGYFLAMALAPEGNVGKAKYLLRVLAPGLKEELI